MNYSRRNFLTQAGSLLCVSPFQNLLKFTSSEPGEAEIAQDTLPAWQFPPLENTIRETLIIDKIELIKTVGQLFLVVKTSDGRKGITQCNDRMQHLVSILKGLVIPHFIKQDARKISQLVDNAYRLNSNYKYSGMALWNCIGTVEIATWDLLGLTAGKPVHALLGKIVRKDYPVYISDFNREGEPEKIASQLLEKLDATGAKGVKIKVGGRMSNTAADTLQTKRLVPVIRKRLGDSTVIYADANGSFTPAEGIATAQFLADYGVEIFEEPCNFEDEDGTRQVTRAVKTIKIAGGEQDTSLYRFKRFAEHNVYQILQPDLYYNGGILRTLHVAAIAKAFGSTGLAPHTPKADPLIGPFWQVASLIPNLYGLQEFVFDPATKAAAWHSSIKVHNGRMSIAEKNGLGIQYDESIWKSAEKILAGV